MSTNNAINNTSSEINVTGSTSGIITIASQAAAGTYNFNLPTTAGTAGQQLTSGGGGGAPMTWSSASGSGITTVNVQTFTTSGTYTPTAGMVYCIVKLVGGGGGGGRTVANGASSGAGGGYAEGLFSAATIGASQTVTIGAGGTAGADTGGVAGGNGGATFLGSLLSATGGGGGGLTAVGYTPGGSGTGGYLQISGQYGGVTGSIYYGGNSQLGQGAVTGITGATGFASNPVGYGAGGGYESVNASGCTAGTPGIVIVTEYIS